MKLFTKKIREKLVCNGLAHEEEEEDFYPVVKLFTPWKGCTWLLSELGAEDPDIAFGLCDLGMGSPELGSVRISEIESIQGPFGLRIERDRYFTANNSAAFRKMLTRSSQRNFSHSAWAATAVSMASCTSFGPAL